MSGYSGLIIAVIVFVGSHFLMSHPLRATMVKALGENGFMGVYSLVSLGSFIWMIFAFRAAPSEAPLWPVGDAYWILASLLTLAAGILYMGSMMGNPAMPMPGAAEAAQKQPGGVFLVTRHPMMWSFALWGLSHILIAPRPDVLIFVGSIVFLALVGAKTQDAKKAKMMGSSWIGWQARTSYWPRLSQLYRAGTIPLIGGLVLWLIATWAHDFFGSYGAGIFRWISN